MDKKFGAIMIVEIAGRPAEHVVQTLKNHVAQLKNMKGVDYLSEKFSEPKQIDVEKDIYTAFAEIEFATQSFQQLSGIVFDFMPSSIEITSPSLIEWDSNEATEYLNNLAGRLHRYDEVAKIAQLQNQQLAQRLQIMQKAILEKEKSVVKKTKKKTKNKKN